MSEPKARSKAKRKPKRKGAAPTKNLLAGARVYLSGPMDFVADRELERRSGWRTRVGAFLRGLGCVVFDPWQKPAVRGLHEYGREDGASDAARQQWTFEGTKAGAQRRSLVSGKFWPILHVDLRMVDTCDFVVAYCPTNIYSVGTAHEIALARSQRKPVLLVSPPVTFPAFEQLRTHLSGDAQALELLGHLEAQLPLKPNPRGIPSLWYMPLVGSEGFFDGFGFEPYQRRFGWESTPLDQREHAAAPVRPLLPFLEALEHRLPPKWDHRTDRYASNDDWLLWDLPAAPLDKSISWPRSRVDR